MADLKISQLGSITVLTPATDVLPVVDVTGTTKKITTNQILGSGGTATLASATITGDLTVDTNVLKVDTTLNRVGIGTATPVSSLQVLDGDITVTTGGSFSGFNGTRQTVPSSVGTQLSRLHFSAYSTGTTYVQGASIQSYSDAAWSASSAPAYLAFYTTPSASVTLSERYRIASDGVATWSNVGGVAGTAMTLNSTGLGVGGSPTNNLAVQTSSAKGGIHINYSGSTIGLLGIVNPGVSNNTIIGSVSNNSLELMTNNSTKATIDSSGNVGIGVTPSVQIGNYKSLQIGIGGNLIGRTDDAGIELSSNAYRSGSGSYIYLNTDNSASYRQYSGTHQWFTAPSGTAGNAITFTQAMTLDASGNLLVGTTGTVVSSDSRFRVSATAVPAVDAKTTAATQAVVDEWNSDTSGDNLFNRFWTESSPIAFRGSISYNRAGGLVAYNTTSDYRAKDIIGPVSNSGSLIDSLKVYVGKMKGATIERPMLIAHELQEVAPYAVSGEKDAVDADGKPKYQQMDASALVPLLIAEIKSLRARVQTLETR